MGFFRNIAAVFLAAGASRRLGRPKQLLPFREKTLLQHQVDQLEGIRFGKKLLVLGAFFDEIKESLQPGDVEILVNKNHEQGLSSSLHEAIQHLQSDENIEAILFLVCDQPALNDALINSLIQAHQPGQITASRYAGTFGVPMIIDRQFWPELLALEGDHGAKAVARKHPDKLLFVDFPGGEFDVDRVEDVERLNSTFFS